MDKCANCGEDYAYRHEFNGERVCLDCNNALGGDLVQELLSKLTEARHERDEALDEKALLRVANANLLAELRQASERAEKAEAERDEARAQAVWVEGCAHHSGEPSTLWIACAPGGMRLHEEGWSRGSFPLLFGTAGEARAAGRALPWWEVQA